MRIDPALQALRSDDAPQRHAQDAMLGAAEAWRQSDEGLALAKAMDAYAAGADLNACGYLSDIFASCQKASAFADLFIALFMPVLADNPLGIVPARYSMNGPVATMVLAGRANVTLSLVSYCADGGVAVPPARSATFACGERHEAILAGSAHIRRVSKIAVPASAGTGQQFSIEPETLTAGDTFSMDTGQQTMLVDHVADHLLTLRLVRTSSSLQPTCEYDLETGALLHQSAADAMTSARELKLALLGRMKRIEAAPAVAALALRNDQPDHLRWQALREALALDTRDGFVALSTVARDSADSLAEPAGALRAQLLETYPVLAGLDSTTETSQCPA
ncbi:MAG: hypothetical protein KDE63_09905 [Novosphingobium sp.]|nr:hypothetical protein [Novosphingobium sp.]